MYKNTKKQTDDFYILIDRLQSCMLKKNKNNRLWPKDIYNDISSKWINKEKQLETLVNKLEKETENI